MHPNQAAVTMFFKALEERDPTRLDASLHEQVRYTGPLFGELQGFRVLAMWQLLFTLPRLAVTVSEMKVTPMHGQISWQLSYSAGRKRSVLDLVTTEVEFRDDRIEAQTDSFSMLRHAVGLFGSAKGYAVGWLPPVHGMMRSEALSQLDAFIRQHGLSDEHRLAPPPPKKRSSGLPSLDVKHEHGQKSNLR